MKKITVLCILFFSVTAVCFGQANTTKSISVTAYYPSPTGVYASLRLIPADAPPAAPLQPGLIYYNNTTDKIVYYNNTLGPIELPSSGGGGEDYWAYNNTKKFLLNNVTNGTVVIGEDSSGGEVLQVNGDMMAYYDTIYGGTGNTSIDIWRGSADNTAALVFDSNPPTPDKYRISLKGDPGILTIDNGTDNAVPWFTVNQLGQVGIGTANQTCKLSIAGTTLDGNISQTLMHTAGDGRQINYIYASSNVSADGPELRMLRSRGTLNPTGSKYPVRTGDSIFKINGNGWNGTAYKTGGFIQLTAGGDFNSTSNPGRLAFYTTPTGSNVPLERMVITSNGSIGINNASPPNKLFVQVSPTVSCYINSTGGWQKSSDRRFKKNISGIEDALAKVLRVQGIRYDPIDDTSSSGEGKNLGFIAQDLETVFPEIVSTGRSGMKGVAYGSITPILVEAIKAQHNQIEVLRKEIKGLKKLKN